MSSATKLVADPTSAQAQEAFLGWLRRMRADEPVYHDAQTGQWHVFGYRDCLQVMNDHHSYKNDLSELAPPQEDVDLFLKGNIAAMDEPRHRRMRLLVSKAFTPRYVASLQPRIGELTHGLLDAVDGRDEFDLVEALAYPLPVIVIAELLGVPADDRDAFSVWARAIHSNGGESFEEMLAVAPSVRAMNQYMLALIRKRRAEPRDDLVTKLVTAEHEGKRLDEEEIVGFIGVLLMAGHLTTTAMLTNFALLFDNDIPQWTAVREDRGLVSAAIEEVVRCRPSFTRFVRMSTVETTVGGRRIPARELVNVWVASANRDETEFTEPDRFDIRRDPNRHVGFGQGIHYCIGAWLARIEGSVALNLLLDRFTGVTVRHDAGVTYLDPDIMMGATELPVRVARG